MEEDKLKSLKETFSLWVGKGGISFDPFVWVCILALFFTVTNWVPLSALPAALGVFFFPFLFMASPQVPPFIKPMLLFLFASVLSVLWYHAVSFGEYDFYRYDGNLFVSYAPLLLLPFMKTKIPVDRWVSRFVIVAIALNACALLVWLATRSVFGGESSYGSFFIARNAAGGFLSIVAGMAFAVAFEKRTPFWWGLFSVAVICLVATVSRGSVLGLVFGLFAFFAWQKKKMWLVGGSLMAVALLVLFLTLQNYPSYRPLVCESDLMRFSSEERLTGKEANVYIRQVCLWPRAWDAFLNSPLIGAGFGMMNDIPPRFKPLMPGVSINEPVYYLSSSSHAHNSYLHILGEMGVLGLLLLCWAWWRVYKFLLVEPPLSTFSWYRSGLFISLFNVLFASFTEHRLTTPATMLPFMALLGLYVVRLKGEFDAYGSSESPEAK